MPGAQLLFVAGVGQAQHGDGMPVLWYVLYRCNTTPADTLRRRVRGLQFRVFLLDALQFEHELIVLGVGQYRVVLDEVLIGCLLRRVEKLECFTHRSYQRAPGHGLVQCLPSPAHVRVEGFPAPPPLITLRFMFCIPKSEPLRSPSAHAPTVSYNSFASSW